jgi:hypothetical protein
VGEKLHLLPRKDGARPAVTNDYYYSIVLFYTIGGLVCAHTATTPMHGGRCSPLLRSRSAAFTSICFPAGYRLCDEILLDSSRVPICANCLASFPEITPGSCDGCGLAGSFDPECPKELSYCQDCQQHRFALDLARSFGF